jgi:hypothetical protein
VSGRTNHRVLIGGAHISARFGALNDRALSRAQPKPQ